MGDKPENKEERDVNRDEFIKEVIKDWKDGKYPDLSHWSAQDKADFVSGLVQIAAKEIMMTFYALGLKTHIECELTNEPTNEKFKFSFIRQPTPQPENINEKEQNELKLLKAAHYAGWYNGLVNAYKHDFSWDEFCKSNNINNAKDQNG